jgi:glycosyltransferase involved in cell wall biosynthesis
MLRKLLRFMHQGAVIVSCALAVALFPVRLVRRLLSARIRSLWCGTPILTLPIKCRAERMLGVDARTLVFHTYYITDAFDYNLSRLISIPVVGRFVPLGVFILVCVIADRLHFFCDRGILPARQPFTFDFRELRVYRWLGIDVFLWTYGADVRNQSTSRAMGNPNACTHCDAPGRYCLCDEEKAMNNMRQLSSLSRAIFAGVGDMFGYTPGSIDDLYFWPLDLEADEGRKYSPQYPDGRGDRPLRIVHAPNHSMFKGSQYLKEAVESLRREGEPVELVLVQKKSNLEALEIYRSADLIFDQCLMGNIGYFALEGMALGKPVMCFVRHPERYLLHPEECPVINTHVNTLKEDIRRVIRERASLVEVGKRGRRYVEKHFSVSAFAQRLQKTYQRLGVSTSHRATVPGMDAS